MAKRFTDTEKWKKRWFRKSPPEMKLFWLFINDQCSISGVWEKDFEAFEFMTGIDINETDVKDFFGDKLYFFDDKILVTNHAFFQNGESLNYNSPVHKKIIDELTKYSLLDRVSNRVFNTPMVEVEVEDKVEVEVSKPKNSKFKKPTIAQISEYIKEKNYSINPETFFNHYEANGWKVGKNSMKNWKASVSGWATRNNETAKKEKRDPYDTKAHIEETDKIMKEIYG